MIRSGCIGLCAGLMLSLFAWGCGSSNSGGGAGGTGGGAAGSTGSGGAGAGGAGNSGSTSTGLWDLARVGSTGTGWMVNVVKGKIFFSAKIGHSSLSDTAGRSVAIAIAKLVAGKSGSGAAALMPAASELPGAWGIDPDKTETANGPAVATDSKKAVDLIDGGADPFYPVDKDYKAAVLAWENFIETDTTKDRLYILDMKIWEMNSASDAKTLYTDLLANSYYSPDNIAWKECTSDATNPCP